MRDQITHVKRLSVCVSVRGQALQDELSSHAQRVSELESLPEISTLAKVLKNALLEVMSRLQQRQQVSNVFQCSGAFANFAGLRATVS